MFRLLPCVALFAAMVATAPALAADWGMDDWGEGESLRGSYFDEPKDWSGIGDEDDALAFEIGLRYWYSWGAQNFSLNGSSVETNDTTHLGEIFARIDDSSTRSYLKGIAGYSIAISGDYSTPLDSGSITGGQVGYAGTDFGWYAFGDGASGVGFLAGYQYWNDSPRTDRDNYAIVNSVADVNYNDDTGDWSVGADGVERDITLHALRLGLTGRASIADVFDITAEVAAIPYASIGGEIGGGVPEGAFSGSGCDVLPPGGCAPEFVRTSAVSVEGWGYGGAAEVVAGFRPAENIKISFGGRAWYLQGTYDATYSGAFITAPQQQPEVDDPDSADPADTIPPDPLYSAPQVALEDYIDTNNPFSMMRYGVFAAISYAF